MRGGGDALKRQGAKALRNRLFAMSCSADGGGDGVPSGEARALDGVAYVSSEVYNSIACSLQHLGG